MAINLNEDMLYVPKVGRPTLTEGISYGFIAITNNHIFYIPQMSQKMGGYTYIKVEQMDVSQFNDTDFWDVVPKLAKEAPSVTHADQFLCNMADEIPGSFKIPFASLQEVKIGFFAQFTVVTAEGKTRFSVGGKRKEIADFLKAKGYYS
jgi:hypothetical protein